MTCRDSNRTPGADCRLFSSPSNLQNVQMSFDVGCFLWTRRRRPKAKNKKKIKNRIRWKFFKKKKKTSRRHITCNSRGAHAFISGWQAAVLDVRLGSSPEADSAHELCLSFTSALGFTLTDLWEIILTKQPLVRVLDCGAARDARSVHCDFSFLFFLSLFSFAQFYPRFTIRPCWTRCEWGFQTTTGNQVVCTRDQPNCKPRVANSQWE